MRVPFLHTDANVTKSHPWNGFNSSYTGDILLEPTDPLFQTLGTAFYKTLIQTYGTDHFYNSDTFNEMDPSSHDPAYLAASNKAVYTAMQTGELRAATVGSFPALACMLVRWLQPLHARYSALSRQCLC